MQKLGAIGEKIAFTLSCFRELPPILEQAITVHSLPLSMDCVEGVLRNEPPFTELGSTVTLCTGDMDPLPLPLGLCQ